MTVLLICSEYATRQLFQWQHTVLLWCLLGSMLSSLLCGTHNCSPAAVSPAPVAAASCAPPHHCPCCRFTALVDDIEGPSLPAAPAAIEGRSLTVDIEGPSLAAAPAAIEGPSLPAAIEGRSLPVDIAGPSLAAAPADIEGPSLPAAPAAMEGPSMSAASGCACAGSAAPLPDLTSEHLLECSEAELGWTCGNGNEPAADDTSLLRCGHAAEPKSCQTHPYDQCSFFCHLSTVSDSLEASCHDKHICLIACCLI
jgi:hypothetical protein